MYLTQEKPYRPLLIALIFLTLPLALLLHEIITVGLFRHSGLLLTFQNGQLRQVAGWMTPSFGLSAAYSAFST